MAFGMSRGGDVLEESMGSISPSKCSSMRVSEPGALKSPQMMKGRL